MAVADELEAALERADRECERVLICLGDCQFIDSTGLAIILHAHRRFGETGRRLAMYGATDQVLRILSISGLTSNGLVFKTADEALATKG